ncbi:unnamed protein product [Ectocarpus sp. CCAP 1310/34]|nr:unnamed protein product [Ectocarpus sp. CCAP 1310/34]
MVTLCLHIAGNASLNRPPGQTSCGWRWHLGGNRDTTVGSSIGEQAEFTRTWRGSLCSPCSSDAFNYFSLSGRKHSVSATFVGLGCLSPTLLRRLRSWYLATLGLPGAAWELDILPLMEIIRWLQNGCKTEISIGDKQTVTW